MTTLFPNDASGLSIWGTKDLIQPARRQATSRGKSSLWPYGSFLDVLFLFRSRERRRHVATILDIRRAFIRHEVVINDQNTFVWDRIRTPVWRQFQTRRGTDVPCRFGIYVLDLSKNPVSIPTFCPICPVSNSQLVKTSP